MICNIYLYKVSSLDHSEESATYLYEFMKILGRPYLIIVSRYPEKCIYLKKINM